MNEITKKMTYFAFINVNLATRTGETRKADAGKRCDSIYARSVILTRRGLAFINVNVAILAGKTGGADTFITVDEIVASSVVLTWMRKAFVEFEVTIIS